MPSAYFRNADDLQNFGVYVKVGHTGEVSRSSQNIWRILVPLIHGGLALALLLNLYLPRFREARRRDIVYQQFIEAEARAKRWPPNESIGFEPDFFGTPQQISALYPADLPALVIAGVFITPNPTSYHLLMEAAPGRLLPSTRLLIAALSFAVLVVAQWFFIVSFNGPPLHAASWQLVVYTISIASVLLGLLLRGDWASLLFRVSSLPLWFFIINRTLSRYRRLRRERVLKFGSNSSAS